MSDPKDIVWKSTKYRRFIRDTMQCQFCLASLLCESPTYEAHHHRHSGGKTPSDQLLIPMCLKCHNEFHANEPRFNIRRGVDEEGWLRIVIDSLSKYLLTFNVNPHWIMIESLRKEIEGLE